MQLGELNIMVDVHGEESAESCGVDNMAATQIEMAICGTTSQTLAELKPKEQLTSRFFMAKPPCPPLRGGFRCTYTKH